jgi:hypothetical protein
MVGKSPSAKHHRPFDYLSFEEANKISTEYITKTALSIDFVATRDKICFLFFAFRKLGDFNILFSGVLPNAAIC